MGTCPIHHLFVVWLPLLCHGMLAEGLFPKCCPPLAAGEFPCGVYDQPPPGHTQLVLTIFGWPWCSVWVKGPSPLAYFAGFGGVGGNTQPGQRMSEPLRGACPPSAPAETSSSLGKGAFVNPRGHQHAAAPGKRS